MRNLLFIFSIFITVLGAYAVEAWEMKSYYTVLVLGLLGVVGSLLPIPNKRSGKV